MGGEGRERKESGKGREGRKRGKEARRQRKKEAGSHLRSTGTDNTNKIYR